VVLLSKYKKEVSVIMVNLPSNVAALEQLLTKRREDLNKAKKAFDYFVVLEKSECIDKFVTVPTEEAKALNKSESEIDNIKKQGKIKAEIEFEKAKSKKSKALSIKEFSKDIKKIKQKMFELKTDEMLNKQQDLSKKTIKNAQNKFELNF